MILRWLHFTEYDAINILVDAMQTNLLMRRCIAL